MSATTVKFTGKERDAETGLDYFGARYMSSAQGRWTSPDRVNLTNARLLSPSNTLNKYVYGGNNPLKFVDPDGNDVIVYYRKGNRLALDTGHMMLAAVNQKSGKAGLIDYVPGGQGPSLVGGLLNQSVPGAVYKFTDADRLKQHSSLYIQTTPEQAQKVIDFIGQIKTSSDYQLWSSNCTTVCVEALRILGVDLGDFPDCIGPGGVDR